MSKTNHRVHKDREEKLGEAVAHKQRRGFKKKVSDLLDTYDPDDETVFELLEDEQFEPVEKIRRRR
jgi:hypothetical protein